MSERRRVLFVTVGTTAIYAEKLGEMDNNSRDLKKLIQEYKGKPGDSAKNNFAANEKLFQRLLTAHRDHWLDEKTAIGSQPYRTSAEMTSTRLLLISEETGFSGYFRPGKDRIVLLASDTAEGKLSAKINAQLMNEFQFAPSCECGFSFSSVDLIGSYHSDDCPSVVIEVVEGMEAKRGFQSTSLKITEVVKRHTDGADIFFNITGGYKGAIPAITWLSANNYSGRPLFYQHETMDRAVRIHFADNQLIETEVRLHTVKTLGD